MPGELSSILRASTNARKKTLEKKRELAKMHNRRVDFQSKQTGFFSLHVANDIAGIWNSPGRGAKVYSYGDLTKSFSRRFTGVDRYFTGEMASKERQSLVAVGMQSLLAGDHDGANRKFEESGATERGLKWINKFSTLMLSERGRELRLGIKNPAQGLTHQALQKIVDGKSDFKSKFTPSSKTVARFVGKGGAKEHRLHAEKLKKK